MRILLAEDERDLNRIITKKLISEGYSVDSCFDGREAMDILSCTDYDAVILDIMMPGADGFTVLSSLRAAGKTTPVLFLTARDSIADRVRGLDSVANHKLKNPFSLEEIMARIRVLIRTAHSGTRSELVVGDLVLDCAAKRVTRGGREITLSAKEYALLEYMMHNPDIVLSREQIEDHIWNYDYEGGTNVVDVYISYLRRKIDDGYERKLIRTVRGMGYVLRGADDE